MSKSMLCNLEVSQDESLVVKFRKMISEPR
nr:MAG TPA: hypothetical protein [Caudoviricetes sp.]